MSKKFISSILGVKGDAAPFTAGHIEELRIQFEMDVTNYQKVFTKPTN